MSTLFIIFGVVVACWLMFVWGYYEGRKAEEAYQKNLNQVIRINEVV